MALPNVRKDLEHHEQVTFIQWCRLQAKKYPELNLMFAIPNGGQRAATTAAKLKREGVLAGVPDLHLPIARGGHHSLFIEMKVGKNRPTKHQELMMQRLQEAGNLCLVCYSAKEAIDATTNYLTS